MLSKIRCGDMLDGCFKKMTSTTWYSPKISQISWWRSRWCSWLVCVSLDPSFCLSDEFSKTRQLKYLKSIEIHGICLIIMIYHDYLDWNILGHDGHSMTFHEIPWDSIGPSLSSSFGATLAHFANSSLPEMAHMPPPVAGARDAVDLATNAAARAMCLDIVNSSGMFWPIQYFHKGGKCICLCTCLSLSICRLICFNMIQSYSIYFNMDCTLGRMSDVEDAIRLTWISTFGEFCQVATWRMAKRTLRLSDVATGVSIV